MNDRDDDNNPFLILIYIKNPRQPLSAEGPAIHWVQSRMKFVQCSNALLSKTGFTSRPPFHLRKLAFPYTTGFLITPHEAVTRYESGPFSSCYNTHSFRIGAATSVEAAEPTESQIKPLADGEAMLTTVTSSQHTPS